jgi:hypothetical protein
MDLSSVPTENQDLREVFNSARPYFFLFIGPTTVMKGYIENSCCRDYASMYRLLGLNDITVKKHFPLPIISAFEPLQGAVIFSNLDLQNVSWRASLT